MIEFRNISDIQVLPEDPPAYFVKLEIKTPDSDWEEVEYCAREGGGGICDEVIAAIKEVI